MLHVPRVWSMNRQLCNSRTVQRIRRVAPTNTHNSLIFLWLQLCLAVWCCCCCCFGVLNECFNEINGIESKLWLMSYLTVLIRFELVENDIVARAHTHRMKKYFVPFFYFIQRNALKWAVICCIIAQWVP